MGTRLLQKALLQRLKFRNQSPFYIYALDSPSSNLKQVFWLYNQKRLSKLSDRDLATVLVYKEGSFSFIPLANVWRPSKKYRIFDHHTSGLYLVGDRILLIQKINYTISTPLFSKGELY